MYFVYFLYRWFDVAACAKFVQNMIALYIKIATGGNSSISKK